MQPLLDTYRVGYKAARPLRLDVPERLAAQHIGLLGGEQLSTSRAFISTIDSAVDRHRLMDVKSNAVVNPRSQKPAAHVIVLPYDGNNAR